MRGEAGRRGGGDKRWQEGEGGGEGKRGSPKKEGRRGRRKRNGGKEGKGELANVGRSAVQLFSLPMSTSVNCL